MNLAPAILLGTIFACQCGIAAAQQADQSQADTAAELARKLANPIASLISVPMKLSWDDGIGPGDVERTTFIVQPVIPILLNQEWNLITRTIIPYTDAEAAIPGGDDLNGLNDILQSFFVSPRAPTASGWVWGAGPVFSYPTATEDALGTEKWSAGPTVVLLKQEHGWTYGVLANHLWSVAGDDDRADVNATFVQPFLSFTTPRRTTWGINTESTYDWRATGWTAPINASVSQLMKFGKQPVSFALAARAYAERPPGGPDWGLSFTFTFLFPK